MLCFPPDSFDFSNSDCSCLRRNVSFTFYEKIRGTLQLIPMQFDFHKHEEVPFVFALVVQKRKSLFVWKITTGPESFCLSWSHSFLHDRKADLCRQYQKVYWLHQNLMPFAIFHVGSVHAELLKSHQYQHIAANWQLFVRANFTDWFCFAIQATFKATFERHKEQLNCKFSKRPFFCIFGEKMFYESDRREKQCTQWPCTPTKVLCAGWRAPNPALLFALIPDHHETATRETLCIHNTKSKA